MNPDFKISSSTDSEGFKVTCYDMRNGKRIPLTGVCSHDTIRKIKETKPASDPVAEVIAVMERSIEVWEEKGLI